MRKITRDIVNAFQGRRSLTISNSRTDGSSLWLFGNKIAEWRSNRLWVSNGGWGSTTTKERLNGITGVHVQQRMGTWYLNGREWNGSWVDVSNWNEYGNRIEYVSNAIILNEESVQVDEGFEFDVTSEWVEQGYSRPIYSVFHILDESSLEVVEQMLETEGIPSRRMESDTAGVYRPNYFIVVRPEDFEDAMSILSEPYCIA